MPNTPPRPVIDSALLNGSVARAQWTNLGYWPGAASYTAAAEELARRAGQAAGLGPGDVVLDVACGHGDSCILWVREFGVARVVGVEPDPLLVAANTSRIAALGLADRITFRCSHAEALDPARTCPDATAVVCVDAAYHFDRRSDWLEHMASGLRGGTRLGLADLLVAPRAGRSARVVRLARRAEIPDGNLWSALDVEPVLADAGFELTRIVRCGPEVLGGFARHTFVRAPALATKRTSGGWRAIGTAASIAMARGRLDYAIIAARTA